MPVPPVIQMYRYVMGSGGGVSNLLQGSEELGSTGVGRWNQDLMNAVNSDQVNNPSGTEQTADQLDFQASKSAKIKQDVTLVAGTEYTFSVWARAASGTQDFRLSYWDNVGRNFGTSSHTASATWSPTTGRYSFTFTAATSGTFSMFIQNAADGATRRIYFWGAMLNVGATALDYVKTEFIGPSSPATPPMEFGDNFAGVTAYYSLRRFTRGADNNAIRVRRSSDDTEQDIGFDANGDLDTTALTTFVNADITQYNYSTATQMVADFSSVGGADSVDTIGGEEALKFTINASSGTHFPYRFNVFGGGGECSISFDYYIPSTNTDIDGIQMSDATNDIGATQTTQDAWTSVTVTGTLAGESIYIFSKKATSKSFTGNGTDVFYIKNLVVTQTTADGSVTTFYDQSGNGNNATNATASEQPLVVSGGTLVTENGKAAVEFDGVDDDLTLSSEILTDTHYMSMVAANTTKGRILGDTTFGYFLESGATNNRFYINFNLYNLGTRIFQTQELVSWSRATTSSEFFQDGTSINSAIVVADDYKFKVIASSSNSVHSDGLIQELIIFDSDQSTNRTGIETNINDHFSIYP